MDAPQERREEMTTETLAVLDKVELIVKQLVTAASQAFLYSAEHPAVRTFAEQAFATMREILVQRESFAVSTREGMLVYENIPLYRLSLSARKFIDYLEARKISGLVVARGLALEELLKFVEILVSPAVKVQGREEFTKELERRGVRAITVLELKKEDEKEGPPREPRVVYEETVRLMRLLTKSAIKGKGLAIADSEDLVSQIAEIVSKDPRAMLDLTSIRDFDEHAFTHAANVCVLSTAFTAMYVEDHTRLATVCQAALLHDIGKLSLPPEILFKPGPLTPAEAELYHLHPIEGARALEEAEGARPLAVAVAYEHHMQYDLKGYPTPEPGTRPHPVSLMVEVCDAYDNLTSPRPGHAARTRAAALAEIALGAGTVFEPAIVKGFFAMMGFYVPGMLVELDDGAIAIVETMHPDHPARPAVKILRGEAQGARLDLREKDGTGAFRRSIRRPIGRQDGLNPTSV